MASKVQLKQGPREWRSDRWSSIDDCSRLKTEILLDSFVQLIRPLGCEWQRSSQSGTAMNREAAVSIQSAEAVALLGGDDVGAASVGVSSSPSAPSGAGRAGSSGAVLSSWFADFALPAGAAIYCAVLSLLSYQHKATTLFALHPILLIFGVLFFMPLAVVRCRISAVLSRHMFLLPLML
jgi:hypothetical protein